MSTKKYINANGTVASWVYELYHELRHQFPARIDHNAFLRLGEEIDAQEDHPLVPELLALGVRNFVPEDGVEFTRTNEEPLFFWRVPVELAEQVTPDSLPGMLAGGSIHPGGFTRRVEREAGKLTFYAATPSEHRSLADLQSELRAANPLVEFTFDEPGEYDDYATATIGLRDWGAIPERFQTTEGLNYATLRQWHGALITEVDFATGATRQYVSRTNSYFPYPQVGDLAERLRVRAEYAIEERRAELRRRVQGWRNAVQEDEADRDSRRQASARRYEAFRRNVRPTNEDVISPLPFVPHGLLSSRRWGIEVETGAGRDLSGTPAGWDSKGDGSLESSYGDEEIYIEPGDCYWAEQHDLESMTYEEERVSDMGESRYVTVVSDEYRSPLDCDECGWRYNGGDWDSDDCVELVSPILTSMHSRGLEQITNDLEHTPWNNSAGVHVHVEAKDLTVQQVRNLVLSYDYIEPLIEYSYYREERGYCVRRATDELLHIVRQADDNPTMDPLDMRKGDRYVTVNLHSLNSHGTVEFRAMGPKYNYDLLVRWAMFCREMVNVHANGATAKDFAKVRTMDDVLAIFEKFGVEYNIATELTKVEATAELVEV